MTDQLLSVFKICLLALLYLFFARVLWAVWSEVRSPKRSQSAHSGGVPHVAAKRVHVQRVSPQPQPQPIMQTAPAAPGGTIFPTAGGKSTKAHRGQVSRMVVIEPRSRKGANFPIGDELTIGRSSGCTVAITDDEFISQVHARAFTQAGQTYVEDLGSTNGSFHNGNRLTAAVPLQKGDRLQIGNTVLEAN